MIRGAWGDRPSLRTGDVVMVHEPGIEPWPGIVCDVKFSPRNGWFVSVRRNDDYNVWAVPSAFVHRS